MRRPFLIVSIKSITDLEPERESGTTQKIIFKKPIKDKDDDSESKGMQTIQSTKKGQLDEKDRSKSKNIKSVKNANLLSFNEDEEDD